jgi:hypothetical protein
VVISVNSETDHFTCLPKKLTRSEAWAEPEREFEHHNAEGTRELRVMSRIRVAFFAWPAQAVPVCRSLNEAGIPAEIHKESRLANLWYVSTRDAGARLEVQAKDAERALHFLMESDAKEDLLQCAIRCPECHSLRVDYPQFTLKSLFTNLAMGLAAEIGLVERNYYCEDCHFMWGKERTRPQRVRQHLAPDYFLEGVRHERPLTTDVLEDEDVIVLRRLRFRGSKKCKIPGRKRGES